MNRLLLLLSLSALVAAPALRAQSFEGLGFLDSADPVSYANDVSADGSVVVGYSYVVVGVGTTTGGAYRWEGSMQALPYTYPEFPYGNYAHGISADGTVTVGWGAGALVGQARAATRWVGTSPQDVGPPFYSEAYAASADGSVVVGNVSTQTLRWDGSPQVIEINSQSAAHDVSADGAVMVGYAFFDDNGAGGAYRWEDGVVTFLPGFPDDPDPSIAANGITPDGTIIVGEARRGTEGHMARWVDGVAEDLGAGIAYSVSAGGNVVVGVSAIGDAGRAVIWTPDGGVQDLHTLLVDTYGLDLTGWTLQRANAVSDDGTTIVGDGVNPDGNLEAWRAVLAPAGLTYTLDARPSEVAVGDTITVAVAATNGGGVPLTDVRPDGPMEATSEDGVEVMLLTGPEPATIALLDATETDSLVYTFEVTASGRAAAGGGPLGGLVEFFVEILATDPGGQTVEGTYECAEPPCGTVVVTAGLLVNSVDDDADEDLEDATCDTGQEVEVDGEMVAECTLRAAIEEANAQEGEDEIAFAIPGGGPHTIRPAGTGLPPLDVEEAAVVLDATTQPGYAGSPVVVLDGSDAGVNASGLRIVGAFEGGSPVGSAGTVKGFAIGNFGWYGIQVEAGTDHTVEANHLGMDAAGFSITQNGRDGLLLDRSGGSTVRDNLISGNDSSGVRIVAVSATYAGTAHYLLGNRIGTNAEGTQGRANVKAGVLIEGEGWNQEGDPPPPAYIIGGPGEGEGNLISGNTGAGLVLLDRALVEGNRIGTNADGTAALGNGDVGIHARGGAHTIRGNVIAGNDSAGVRLGNGFLGAGASRLLGNRIGTNAAGAAALPNGGPGVRVEGTLFAGAPIIGGLGADEGNLISGNAGLGLLLHSGAELVGNRIGTNAAGTAALPNAGGGIETEEAGLRIEDNLISGNAQFGLRLVMDNAISGSENLITRNLIGTDVSGTHRLPNDGPGVHFRFERAGSEQLIGEERDAGAGPTETPANVISGNLGPGVWVEGVCDMIFNPSCEEVHSALNVSGNYIGTDATGTQPLGNLGPGVLFEDGTKGIAVTANLISANADGIVAQGALNEGIYFRGNLIGADITRGASLPNLGDGIRIQLDGGGSTGPFRGDLVTIRGNTVAGNGTRGIAVLGNAGTLACSTCVHVSIEGNRIGFSVADGAAVPMGNAGAGVHFEDAEYNRTGYSGGFALGGEDFANVIAYNGGPGIVVASGHWNYLAGNWIFDNGGLPIDLGGDGTTGNDNGDEDGGPNERQNHPEVTGAYLAAGEIFLEGHLSSSQRTDYKVDLFVNATGVPGFGDAQGFLITRRVTTPLTSGGFGEFRVDFTGRLNAVVIVPTTERAGVGIDPVTVPVAEGWVVRGLAAERYSDPLLGEISSYGSTSELSFSGTAVRPAPETDEGAAAGGTLLPMGGDGFDDSGDGRRGGAAFAAGDTLLVCPACANEEVVAVAAVEAGALVLAAPLAQAHAAGEAVVPFARSVGSILVTADTLAAFGGGTAVTMRFDAVAGGGTVTVERLRRAPAGTDGIAEPSVLPHRWTASLDSTLVFAGSTELHIALDGIPALTLTQPENVVVYHRPVPGVGPFSALTTVFDTTAAAFVATGFTALGEFVLATDEDVDTGEEPGEVPEAFALSAAYPNPFNPTTVFNLDMPEAGQVAVTVYDALGRRVVVLLDGELEAGTHAVRFEAQNLPSGVYLIRAITDHGTQTRAVTLLR